MSCAPQSVMHDGPVVHRLYERASLYFRKRINILKSFRFSKRQVERKARRLLREENDNDDSDGSRGRTSIRSCSPASSKTVIEAAIARKNNVNDTDKSCVKSVKAASKSKTKTKKSSRSSSPSERISASVKSHLRPVVSSVKKKKEKTPDACLEFSVASLSKKQQLSLDVDEDSPCSEKSSVRLNRNPSLDLTCSETMSLDIENLSPSPASHPDLPSPIIYVPSPIVPNDNGIQDEVESLLQSLLDNINVSFNPKRPSEATVVKGSVEKLDLAETERNISACSEGPHLNRTTARIYNSAEVTFSVKPLPDEEHNEIAGVLDSIVSAVAERLKTS